MSAGVAAFACSESGPAGRVRHVGRGKAGRLLPRVKAQYAKLKPETAPRKLRASERSRLKQGSNGRPRNDAQYDCPFTRKVPAGSVTKRTGPSPRIWIVPATEPSP